MSRRLDLDLSTPLFTEASNRTVVITAADAPPDRLSATAELADVICAGDGVVDLSAGVAQLRERGVAHLVCEGGPTLLGALLAEGLVDELCTTLTPRVVGGSAGRIVNGPWLPDETWHLRQLLRDRRIPVRALGAPMKLPLSPPIAPMLAKSVKGVRSPPR